MPVMHILGSFSFFIKQLKIYTTDSNGTTKHTHYLLSPLRGKIRGKYSPFFLSNTQVIKSMPF